MNLKLPTPQKGLTLIEVLLALMVIAIAFTALLQANSTNLQTTSRLKEKMISHWVAMQGISMVQLDLLPLRPQEETTHKTKMLGQVWYWRVKLTPTPIHSIQQINITLSATPTGPFRDLTLAYKYEPHAN